MAINSIGQDVATYGDYTTQTATEDKSELSNDDFMTLLLVELQNQDPTEPTDTETILTQTSELATLESSDKTNKALDDLTKSLASSDQFSSIAAIGKTADLGSDAISYEEGGVSSFEVYFPSDVKSGTMSVTDSEGNLVSTINLEESTGGIQQFDWDGKEDNGDYAKSGIYNITANYTDSEGSSQTTKLGVYPIESIKFDEGDTLAKVGSNYVSMDSIKEIY